MIIEKLKNRDRTIVVSVGHRAIYVEVSGQAIRLSAKQADLVAEALDHAIDRLAGEVST